MFNRVMLLSLIVLLSIMPALTSAQVVDQLQEDVFLRQHHVDVEINNQVATTRIEQVFVNPSNVMAEGTYIFPLPRGAAVSDLVMFVDGEPITARILDADEARSTYEEIVRTLRDPALLEYIGQDAIQASVFPIPANEEIKIEIEYSHVLTVENGLVAYEYPLRADQFSRRPVGSVSVSVRGTSNDPISSVYSPSHPVAVNRDGEFEFTAGYEATSVREASNFKLYYGLADDNIDLNLLTYRESATEDGFFLLLVTPPVEVDEERIVPKDVIIVLDQSGSMFGEKWDQARAAAQFVLDNLNNEDRFNVIAFSTGWRVFGNGLQNPSEAPAAQDWLDGLEAIGGTDINGALTEAFSQADDERQTVVLFLTDGLATEGETTSSAILDNAIENAPENVRMFTFGVGFDVDTFLLDQLHEALRGTGAYVSPEEDIEAEVSTLYSKIAAPVLTDIEIDFGDVVVEDFYPGEPLPDLFVGTQLIVAGRYRGDGETNIVLTGDVNGETQTFTYSDINFPANAGGEELIPRLWATRKIGALLNSIRLNGESDELIDSIVRLSVRYGIITPYTSFFIDETDIFTAQGRDEAMTEASESLRELDNEASGEEAFAAADGAAQLEDADAAPLPPSAPDSGSEPNRAALEIVGDKTFVSRDGVWIDTAYDADSMTPIEITFLSDAYFELLDTFPEVGDYLALGEAVLFVLDGQAYAVGE